jgi:hypothetical protein
MKRTGVLVIGVFVLGLVIGWRGSHSLSAPAVSVTRTELLRTDWPGWRAPRW